MAFNDKCAVAGVWNHPSASFLTYLALYALQHRGQEGAGIVSLYEGKHLSHKSKGLVGPIFSKKVLEQLKGSSAIGHTRYSTTGLDEFKNIQPFTKELDLGPLSVAHNGNIVNYSLLKERFLKEKRVFTEGDSDTECLFPLIAHYDSQDIGERLLKALSDLEGAYSLVFLSKDSLIAVRDPMGFRPLVLGQKGESFVVASETCAFDLIGAKYLREIQNGEILIINKKGMKSLFLPPAPRKAQCIFEYVYFSRPDSFVFNQNVYERRKKMGERLAKEHPVKADMVIPVPDSGIPAAIAYAQTSGLPYEMGIIRNHYIGRTFIHPSPLIRNFKVKIKLNPQSIVKGKRVVAIDDSIVRGTTSKALVEILRSAGAKEVHLRVSSPPIKSPCYYGVDTPQKKQLISGQKHKVEQVRQFIGADSLAYLSYEGLMEVGGAPKDFCSACFDENYPTPIYNH